MFFVYWVILKNLGFIVVADEVRVILGIHEEDKILGIFLDAQYMHRKMLMLINL